MEIQWPLIIFTLFVALAGGIFCLQGVLAFQGKGQKIQMPALIAAFISVVIGGIASFIHLEHWDRIFNGFGHLTSGITQELIGIVIVGIAMVVYFVMLRKNDGIVPKWTAVLAIVTSALLVFLMGHSYLMPSRPVWDTLLLVLYYLANAFLFGSLTIWMLASALKSDDSISLGAKMSLIASIVMAIIVAAYAIYIVNVDFSEVGYYFDPTSPTAGLTDPGALATTLFTGSLATYFWLGVIVIGIVVPLLLAVLKKKEESSNSGITTFAGVGLVCALVGGICWRVILYVLGASVFIFF
ncbi:MAG: dimethyl sulfoxide reductase anchor subunit [Actinobacteria bacterium]|nr:dimethyl sulfoxide reductase anchor subunit [Actinomycetota bacterium]